MLSVIVRVPIHRKPWNFQRPACSLLRFQRTMGFPPGTLDPSPIFTGFGKPSPRAWTYTSIKGAQPCQGVWTIFFASRTASSSPCRRPTHAIAAGAHPLASLPFRPGVTLTSNNGSIGVGKEMPRSLVKGGRSTLPAEEQRRSSLASPLSAFFSRADRIKNLS